MSFLSGLLPDWLMRAVEWLNQPAVLWALALGSLFLLVASVVGVPWFVARLPEDYLTRRELAEHGLVRPRRTIGFMLFVFLRNLIGLLLLVGGIAMLVLPGQGLLSLLVALMLLDFPGKRLIERRILATRLVFSLVNRLRKRAGKPPIRRSEGS
jgi:Na+/H+ antiporter NhaD/arsenite permease-like protein